MATFTYDHSIESPSSNISHVFGFSHEGTYLALGDSVARRVHILETDMKRVTCIPTVVASTSLVWDPVETKQFIVGFDNGKFSICSFRDVEVTEVKFDALKDRGAVQSLALTRDGLTLAVAVSLGDVFIFKRTSHDGLFELIINATSEYSARHTIHGEPPSPRSLCFAAEGVLFVSYERDGIISVAPTQWNTSKMVGKKGVPGNIGRGELPLLRAITSSDYGNYPTGMHNFWVYSASPQDNCNITPFLFVDRGTTILQVDPRAIVLSNSITRKVYQQLDDDGNGLSIYREGGGDGPLHVAYFANHKGQWIATARGGRDGNIKFWYADPSTKKNKHEPFTWSYKTIYIIFIASLFAFALAVLMKREDDPGKGINNLLIHYQHAIADYHGEVNARVDRLREDVSTTVDDMLKVLQAFISD